jgi:hypothetical protein
VNRTIEVTPVKRYHYGSHASSKPISLTSSMLATSANASIP